MESNNEKEIRARTDKDRIPLQSYSHVGSEVMTTSIIRSDDLSAEVAAEPNNRAAALMEEEEPSKTSRQSWSNHLDFVITLLGFAVGLGNLWRFPYLCFQHGGGAFLVPYLLFMVASGAPLFFLEVSLGQFSQQSAIQCWSILPMFKGIGIASTLIVFYCNTYYIVILAWACFYFFTSFMVPLGFSTCDNHWNTPNCYQVAQIADELKEMQQSGNGSDVNFSNLVHQRVSSVDEYWIRHVLMKHMSSGVDDPGSIVLHLAGCLFFVWVLCFLCIFKGIHISGKVVYFTALFPYVIITCMIIRGCTLEGSAEGILFYLRPDFSKLSNSKVWIDAGTQIFFSYALCLGVLPTLGSFNDYHNNVLRDSIIISIANPATSVFAGFGVFSILGHLAHVTGLPISEVTDSGPGLVFKTYPVAISLLPGSNFWAILFFFMIILLGFDSQFSGVESFVTSIMDVWPWLRQKRLGRPLFTAAVCLTHFFIGLSMVTEGGVYVFEIWNSYSASGKNLLLIALFELVALMYIYGYRKYRRNIVDMLGYDSWILTWFQLCWCVFSPILILGILTFDIVEYFRGNGFLTYGDYVYPKWADAIGWVFVLTAVLCIPTYAAYQIALSRANLSCIRKKRRKKQQRTSNAHWPVIGSFHNRKDSVANNDETNSGIIRPEVASSSPMLKNESNNFSLDSRRNRITTESNKDLEDSISNSVVLNVK
ncbi:sodium- and chloride-dependent GABA transporter 1-like [Symsagittifera roscoffensis]|uniref:sodium- and chloride-dependent GABA transporter 1-like n=1 Tax=Symsagittifera roscoffensis TaxID=84072 RepID=UPI00307B8382